MVTANVGTGHGMSREELRLYAAMQVEEINKYKWCLGVSLGYDPLRDRCLNDIAREWIEQHGANFRRNWIYRYSPETQRAA